MNPSSSVQSDAFATLSYESYNQPFSVLPQLHVVVYNYKNGPSEEHGGPVGPDHLMS